MVILCCIPCRVIDFHKKDCVIITLDDDLQNLLKYFMFFLTFLLNMLFSFINLSSTGTLPELCGLKECIIIQEFLIFICTTADAPHHTVWLKMHRQFCLVGTGKNLGLDWWGYVEFWKIYSPKGWCTNLTSLHYVILT